MREGREPGASAFGELHGCSCSFEESMKKLAKGEKKHTSTDIIHFFNLILQIYFQLVKYKEI